MMLAASSTDYQPAAAGERNITGATLATEALVNSSRKSSKIHYSNVLLFIDQVISR
jgi:hypothetical protein